VVLALHQLHERSNCLAPHFTEQWPEEDDAGSRSADNKEDPAWLEHANQGHRIAALLDALGAFLQG
jgi:hypothetical protein